MPPLTDSQRIGSAAEEAHWAALRIPMERRGETSFLYQTPAQDAVRIVEYDEGYGSVIQAYQDRDSGYLVVAPQIWSIPL